MSEWWTYRLTSFLLFSPRTYHRLFELYNLAVWPAQLVGVAIGGAIIALLVGRSAYRDRIVAALLAACWLWVAWRFLYLRYAQINWVAPWFAAAFALEGLLLVALGTAGRIAFGRSKIALAMIAIVTLGYPLLAPLTGRAWTTAESFGVTPDPTAIATVAVLALAAGRIRWLLLAIPLLWCAIAAATQRAMGEPESFVIATAALLSLLPAFRRTAISTARRSA